MLMRFSVALRLSAGLRTGLRAAAARIAVGAGSSAQCPCSLAWCRCVLWGTASILHVFAVPAAPWEFESTSRTYRRHDGRAMQLPLRKMSGAFVPDRHLLSQEMTSIVHAIGTLASAASPWILGVISHRVHTRIGPNSSKALISSYS